MNIILCLFFKISISHTLLYNLLCFSSSSYPETFAIQYAFKHLLNNVACASRIRDLALSLSLNKLDYFWSVILYDVENWHGNSGHEPCWETLIPSIDSMLWNGLVGSLWMKIFETLSVDKLFIENFYLWACMFHSIPAMAFSFLVGETLQFKGQERKEKKEGRKRKNCMSVSFSLHVGLLPRMKTPICLFWLIAIFSWTSFAQTHCPFFCGGVLLLFGICSPN